MPSQLPMRKRAESLIWTIIGGGAATRMILAMTNTCLLQQNTSLAATKVCLPRQSFCCDKQVCHDKGFVTTSILLLRQKMCFVVTNMCLSQQKWACHDKTFVATSLLLSRQNTSYVMTKLLLQQKWFLWQLPPIFNSLSTNHSVTSERETDQHMHTHHYLIEERGTKHRIGSAWVQLILLLQVTIFQCIKNVKERLHWQTDTVKKDYTVCTENKQSSGGCGYP